VPTMGSPMDAPALMWLQVLHDAVLFGVIPIVYEFEGTSLEYLLHRLDSFLHGRTARSV